MLQLKTTSDIVIIADKVSKITNKPFNGITKLLNKDMLLHNTTSDYVMQKDTVLYKMIYKQSTGIAKPPNKGMQQLKTTLEIAIIADKGSNEMIHKPFIGTAKLPSREIT